MITASNSSSTSNKISQNINNLFYNPSQTDEINLYSTVKNKKFNIFNTNDHNSGIDNDNLAESIHYGNKESPTHSNNHHQKTLKQYQCQQQQSYSKKVYLNIDSSDNGLNDHNSIKKIENLNMNCSDNNLIENLKIVEETSSEQITETVHKSPSKTSYDYARQQLLLKQERSNSLNTRNSPKHANQIITSQMQHLKLSPSKSMTMTGYSLTQKPSVNKQNSSHPQLDMVGTKMPTKDSVIRKMKKITKAVQELFQATKESDFNLFKGLCEKVNKSVHEMIVLFPQHLNSQPIEENLFKLIENSRNLTNLIVKYSLEIDSFSIVDYEGDDLQKSNTQKTALSASSSSSSAISSGSELPVNMQQHMKQHSQESPMLKNMIVSNLVTYSYEIAYTVKRIVCIMGAESS